VLRIVSHEPFCGRKTAIEKNMDIANSSRVFERMDTRIKIAQTDIGAKLQAQADALRDLLSAYKAGAVPEDHRE
jgi:fructose-1,6-bisphosphatase-3